MKSSTARATSKPTNRATTTATATERGKASPARTRASPARTPARTAFSPARTPARTAASPVRTSSKAGASPARTTASPVRTPAKAGASPARTTASPVRTPAKAGAAPARTAVSPVKTSAKAASPSATTSAKGEASPARSRGSLTKTPTMSATEPSITPPRHSTSSAAPTRQSALPTRIPTFSSSRASVSRSTVSPPHSSSMEGNSPVKSNSMMTTTRIPSPKIVKGTSPARNSVSPRQILSHEFLSLTTAKSRGQSPLNRSMDDPNQLRRLSAPASNFQYYMSKSHDHGSFALNRSIDRGPKFSSKIQNQGPKSLSTSQDRGFKSLSTSQDRGFKSSPTSQGGGFKSLSTSQDRGFMSKSQDRGSYANQNTALRKSVPVPEYGFDGRRKSTSGKDTAATRLISAGLNRRDTVSLHLQMGRSVDSTVSFSTVASSPARGNRQSFQDTHRLIPLQLSDPVMSQGYRSGDLTPDEASPLDGRIPARKHRQLKSPDFFDVKKLDGDGGVITAVARVHHKVQRTETTAAASSEDDQDSTRPKLHAYYEQRRDRLADSARKAFSVETDSGIGSSDCTSEIDYKLEKELNNSQDLLEIGSWNDDDEEYLRVYKPEVSVDTGIKSSEPVVAVHKSNEANGSSKKWRQNAEFGHLSQYDNALYQKSEPDSDLGTSTQASPQTSPPRVASAVQPAAVSRISSTSATSIDLNRSTDTTCSTYSLYDNAFWAETPIKGTFQPWNPNREAEMTPSAAVPPTFPAIELAHPPLEPPPVANTAAENDSRILRYNDGLERLTSYMKAANQSTRKKRGLSDDLTSSQASGCFDYLVDYLDSQTSIADVLVSAHDETLKLNDFTHSVGCAHVNPATVKRLDSKMTNDTAMLSSRSSESRITDLGSEASWESGKSRSVQTLGTTGGKVMDQITERVDSLSFDSPKHLSTFKFGLKKTTLGACETIISSDHGDANSDGVVDYFPQRKSVSIPMGHPESSPNMSWPSQTAPSSINASRNPSRNPSRNLSRNASNNPSRSPSQRTSSDATVPGTVPRQVSPPSASSRQIKIVSEAGVESRPREEADSPPPSSTTPPVAEDSFLASPERLLPLRSFKKMRVDSPKAPAAAGSTSPTVEPPTVNVQMRHESSDEQRKAGSCTPERGAGKRNDRYNLSLRLDPANKGCGCNIL